MLQQSLDYTGEYINLTPDVYDPDAAGQWILNGSIPNNLTDISHKSNAFRDATLSYVLTNVQDQDALLALFCSAVRHSDDDSIKLKVYVEYLAAIAMSFERKDIAGKAIMRMKPQYVGQSIWSIVSAMKKQMPGTFYASLLMSQGMQSSVTWGNERGIYFPDNPVSLRP